MTRSASGFSTRVVPAAARPTCLRMALTRSPSRCAITAATKPSIASSRNREGCCRLKMATVEKCSAESSGSLHSHDSTTSSWPWQSSPSTTGAPHSSQAVAVMRGIHHATASWRPSSLREPSCGWRDSGWRWRGRKERAEARHQRHVPPRFEGAPVALLRRVCVSLHAAVRDGDATPIRLYRWVCDRHNYLVLCPLSFVLCPLSFVLCPLSFDL
jgi:hypothetical protein